MSEIRQFTFGKNKIRGDEFLLIAEIGNNHNGSVDLCCKMMTRAAECGAHAVKLQKRNIETFWSKEMLDMPYINPNSYGNTYREHKKVLEFGKKEWETVVKYAKSTIYCSFRLLLTKKAWISLKTTICPVIRWLQQVITTMNS